MKITWLDVSSSFSHSSLALPLLHASARHVPAEWDVVRATIHDRPGPVSFEVWQQQPDVLAAGVYLFSRRLVLQIVARVRTLSPDCRIILGGPEFLGPNETFLHEHRAVDAVVRGEGERSFPSWLQTLDHGGDWAAVPGLCWIDDDDRYHEGGRAAAGEDLEALPSPLSSPFYTWDKPFAQLETARGCTARCTYCTSCATGPVRVLSDKRVAADLHACREHDVTEIRLLDRTFNAQPRRCCRLLALFRDEFADMRFHLEWHPAILTSAMERELAAAPPGQLHLEVGLQTTSRESLEAIGRNDHTGAGWAGLVSLAGLRDLSLHVDLLYGLPGLTLGNLTDDLSAIVGLGVEEVQVEALKVLPGTPLQEDASRHGILYSPTTPYEVLRTPHMPPGDCEAARLLSRLVDQFHNRPELREGVRVALQSDPRALLSLLAFVRTRGGPDVPMSLERRFRLLHEFGAQRPPVRQAVERAWLRCGFSPLHGIAPASLWRDPLPSDAELLEGERPPEGAKARTWWLAQSDAEYWFVFDRAVRRRPATGVFRRPTNDRGASGCPERAQTEGGSSP